MKAFLQFITIEVISQKTAQRVMDSITKYIESKLLLKVNRKKSKIGRPIEIKYLGFTFYNQFKAKKYKAKAHEKSVQKVVRKLKQLTSRRWGVSNSIKAQKITEMLRGWINYFKIGSILTVTRKLDTMLRYRFTMKQKLPGSQKSANYPLKLLIAYFELNW